MSIGRRWRAGCVIAVPFCLLLGAGVARADTPPNVWDVAGSPAIRDQWKLHVRVERLLAPAHPDDDSAPGSTLDLELRLETAKAMLENAEAAHSPDVRLRFDLGFVYYGLAERQVLDSLYQKAIDVLVPALASSPDHPAATEALATLVYCYAKLNFPREELAAWRQYIPRLVDDGSRVVAMMNMGEAEMRLGQIDDALGTFREVLRLCGELPNSSRVSETYVLGLWDVAIALDRSGDPQGALDAAGQARRMVVGVDPAGRPVTGSTLIAPENTSVFFVPPWEREWYLALDAMAAARSARDPRAIATAWAQAEGHWTAYFDRSAATGGTDPFLSVARLRLRQAHDKRLAADQTVARLPKRPPPHGPAVEPWAE
jgi:tetratricopeptide (TPR) repeat protein